MDNPSHAFQPERSDKDERASDAPGELISGEVEAHMREEESDNVSIPSVPDLDSIFRDFDGLDNEPSSTRVSELEDDECPICCLPYEDEGLRRPHRPLHCEHVLCGDCLGFFFEASRGRSDLERHARDGEAFDPCPSCVLDNQHEAMIAELGHRFDIVDTYKTGYTLENYTVLRLSELEHHECPICRDVYEDEGPHRPIRSIYNGSPKLSSGTLPPGRRLKTNSVRILCTMY
ncbi:hypothetical protein EJ04DRAFT_530214 [Polyplosphaeria fusca]|uniref:RING-type domain-containing protein n=1 Tax=Polyplosphaeria fusca TaxID=682080 RepID=A0A9P4UTV1_9PLEO|nr:hypothetical protein EJ04DRAFT_530214 [Polyplosphaeria fusca]